MYGTSCDREPRGLPHVAPIMAKMVMLLDCGSESELSGNVTTIHDDFEDGETTDEGMLCFMSRRATNFGQLGGDGCSARPFDRLLRNFEYACTCPWKQDCQLNRLGGTESVEGQRAKSGCVSIQPTGERQSSSMIQNGS